MNLIHELKSWLSGSRRQSVPLQYMKLGPDGSTENPLMIQFFTWDAMTENKSWWRHVADEMPQLSEMGFTQIWLPPPNKAAEKNGRGYDAYDLWDLGEFDQKGAIGTRWGTKEELLHTCETAKYFNIDIIIDAVLNHKIGADRIEVFPAVPVDKENRLKEIGKVRDIEGWTAYDFPARGDKYSTLRWNQEHFTGFISLFSYLQDRTKSFEGLDWDHKTRTNEIYRIVGKGHKGWSKQVDQELGNYDYLLGIDIDHRHPAVQEDFLKWGPWILQTTGAVGFRFDAIKHIHRPFLLSFVCVPLSDYDARTQPSRCKILDVPRIQECSQFLNFGRESKGVSSMSSSAVFNDVVVSVKAIKRYLTMFKNQTAFFDVPLHHNFHEASKQGANFDLRTILDNTLVKSNPGYAVTFVDNHDTVSQMLESWVGSNFKVQAYALILLRDEGYPCVFYGDLYPHDPKCFLQSVADQLKLLIQARRMFAYGPTQDYLEGKNCIGFVRKGDSKHNPCVVLLSNREDDGTVHSIRMNVGSVHAESSFSSFMTDGEKVKVDQDGWGSFTCSAGGLSVWIKL
ncbi:hypothetical protein D9758_003711 [Tetrapyrgos nigripes]|uniref:Glycosyl hydrolase family 13 catalytic domain-containing protein n=1 Tax=Tetrapyrgos nigripes TaxID=182062 RepID=A0A8H5GMR9_9AGAR|nr:hypothetical protein D9758_003711 [Tetrapyrgos nigripes]